MPQKTDLAQIADTALEWRDGVPIAPDFNDVYYSLEGGLDETNYVFIEGIGAPEVWENKHHYTIAETGFGTGLNFLATWKKWQETGQIGRLTFISVEQFPLSRSALKKAHCTFPDVSEQAEKLRNAWPPATPGFHHRFFEDGNIELILIFGEASEGYARLDAEVDAWFLDGFAPSKNPDMWRDELFLQMARLSKPGAPFATFTAAGFVKRGLAAVGFEVKKTKGFGRKRERLVGLMNEGNTPQKPGSLPGWAKPPSASSSNIAIIGAGIAGRSLAAALTRRGKSVTIFSDNTACASRVPSAILAPAFQAEKQPASEFIETAFCHACSYPGYSRHWQGKRGTLVAPQDTNGSDRQHRIKDRLGWSNDDLQHTGEGLFYAQGGSIDSHKALEAIWPGNQVIFEEVSSFRKTESGWLLETGTKNYEFPILVVAAGAATPFVMPEASYLSMGANGGQIAVTNHQPGMPEYAYASAAYVTAPEHSKCTAGSTFEDATGRSPKDWQASSTVADLQDKLCKKLPFALKLEKDTRTWAGVRATSHDYLPLIGPVPDWAAASKVLTPLAKNKNAALHGSMPYQEGLYLMTAFGSKGFQQAPYGAEILAAMITEDALPLPYDQLEKLAPSRFHVRQVIKGKAG